MAGSAQDIIQSFLDQYGLGSLGSWAWQQYLDSGATNISDFMPQLNTNLQQTQEFKTRFPAYDALIKAGKGISIDQYVNYEQTVGQLLQQYGVPRGMYDTPSGIASLLISNVSASEVNDRLKIAADAAFNAPQEVRDALRANYGVDPGGLIGYYLDPDKAEPLLAQQYAASQVSAAAVMNGMTASKDLSERLAAQGVSFGQAQQGFGNAANLKSLESGPGEQVSNDELATAQFGDSTAAKKVDRVATGRVNQFKSGGGAADSATQGVVGLGQ